MGMIFTILLVALTLSAPDPRLTPGAILPLTKEQICSTVVHRDVSAAKKRRVYNAYGIPLAARTGYVIDHLIPLEIGGANVVANLWPQTRVAAAIKDLEENRLHHAVCAGTVELLAAQQAMREWHQ